MEKDWEEQFQTIVSEIDIDPDIEPIKGWEARQVIGNMNEAGMWLGKLTDRSGPQDYVDLPEETWITIRDMMIEISLLSDVLCETFFEREDEYDFLDEDDQ